MKKSHGFTQHLHLSTSRIVQCIWITCFSILISSLIACNNPEKKEYGVLKIYGNGEVANFTKSFITVSTKCGITQPGGLMVDEGDLLSIEEWPITFQSSLLSEDKALHFIISDSVLLIDGQFAGIAIDTPYAVRKMLRGIDTQFIKNIKVLKISKTGYESYGDEIKTIAGINPDCQLVLSETLSDEALAQLLDWFSPTTFSVAMTAQQHQLLKKESQLKSLYVSNTDSILMANQIPALPNLKNIIYFFNGDSISTDAKYNQFLVNNPQLENVGLFTWNAEKEGIYATGILRPLKNIRELALDMPIADSEILAHKATLEKLTADNEYLQLQIPHLRWATISEQQSIFDSLVASKPNLQVLEIIGSVNALDLQNANQLKGLQALILVHTDSTKISPLFQLKTLKLLSYSLSEGDSDSTIQALRTALPNTLVVPNDGFCVGSGYLMLLLPMLAIALLMANAGRKRKPSN